MPSDTDETARVGFNAIEAIFLKMGWIFREQPIRDYGIDAQVEVKNGANPTGKLIALQIKSGPSYFRTRGSNYVYYGKRRHLDYWDNHSLPVFIILHNPVDNLTLWQRVDRRLVKMGKDGAWSIDIPPTNILNEGAATYLSKGIASDPEAIRRFRMSMDAPLISLIAEKETVFFTLEDWVNKTLNIRSVEVRYDDPDEKEPDLELDYAYAVTDVADLMSRFFPWLSYAYVAPIQESSSEVWEHRLEVSLNDVGRAFVALKKFYEEGPDDVDPPVPPDPTEEDMDEGEWQEYQFRKALQKDWEDENS